MMTRMRTEEEIADAVHDCKQLWAGVMQEAVDSSLAMGSGKNERRGNARRFFTATDGMFEWICGVLGYDADVIREKMKEKWKAADREAKNARAKKSGQTPHIVRKRKTREACV